MNLQNIKYAILDIQSAAEMDIETVNRIAEQTPSVFASNDLEFIRDAQFAAASAAQRYFAIADLLQEAGDIIENEDPVQVRVNCRKAVKEIFANMVEDDRYATVNRDL